ncbi:MAG: GNAT family N-acetyltransferase [Lachnospiraceae bacterium]|nr:GNAT family N-acetyltransferase [Lachnospiraceae bacterium]
MIDNFKDFLRKFFADDRNAYYIWEADGEWVSALRLTRLEGCYFLEALETKPECRKRGYSLELFTAVYEYLGQHGPFVIRDHVSKRNTASLAAHKRAGFTIEFENAVEFMPGLEEKPENPRCYGLIYRSDSCGEL